MRTCHEHIHSVTGSFENIAIVALSLEERALQGELVSDNRTNLTLLASLFANYRQRAIQAALRRLVPKWGMYPTPVFGQVAFDRLLV